MLNGMAKHLAEPEDTPTQPPLWRTKTAISAVLMLVVSVLTVFAFRWLTADQAATSKTTLPVDQIDEPFDAAQPPEPAPDAVADEHAVVHVAGEVQDPGIVELETGARVIDAIEGAGGPTDQAQLDALNLAAVINDGDYILVPDRQAADTPSAQAQPGGTAPASSQHGTVNLNTADAAELETLPGIGPATAAQIIAHREQHGPFTQLMDIEAVSGIGPATRERLDGLVSW